MQSFRDIKKFPWCLQNCKGKATIYKGSNTYLSNYRPISLLPFLSKVFDRVVFDRKEEFLSINKILYDIQSGFKKTTQQIHVFLFWLIKF